MHKSQSPLASPLLRPSPLGRFRRKNILFFTISFAVLYYIYRVVTDTQSGPSLITRFTSFSFCPSQECIALEQESAQAKLCTYCDCSVSPPIWPMPVDASSSTGDLASDLHEYVHHLIRDAACQHVFTPIPAAAATLQRDLTPRTNIFGHKPMIYETNLKSLRPELPTQFVITKTGPRSKIAKKRPEYFDRLASAIHDNLDSVAKHGYRDGTPAHERQTLWIIAEDSDVIDPDVLQVFKHHNIPFVYFSYGPVHHWGKAQVNAIYRIIHGLLGVVGYGPLISVDDDSLVKSELFDRIWKVNKVVVWPMGNLGPHDWETPIWENGRVVGFDAWWTERAFPLDAGAFAHNTSLIGNEKPISPPDYWTSDTMGGESEFLELFCDTRDDLEQLCDDGEECHFAWHNWFTIELD